MTQEIMELLLTNVVEVIIGVLSIVVGYLVIPAIKNDLVPWLKEMHLFDVVHKLVEAAEKLAETGVIEKKDKKQYVENLLIGQGIAINGYIESLIEAAVKELDQMEEVFTEVITEE